MKPIILEPIGVIRSSFQQAAGTPIQSCMAAGSPGRIELYPEYTEGLKDLEGFDRLWLLYWFDRAAPANLLVKPFMDEQPRGLFSTRAPSRPNPIGLSCVRLLTVEGGVLHISDVDILDRTPLLDIKPYNPRFDAFPTERCGWMDAVKIDPSNPIAADRRFEPRKENPS
ncbi:MAG: tRNA (N6-threonylcarbamoyladenosine(37)-N6)-methyltransferase TrmO [Candidatus Omnitrophota bacterium]